MIYDKFISLLLSFFLVNVNGDDFKEELFIKPLPPNNIYAFFQFLTIVNSDVSDFGFKHSQLAPRSLGEIISRFEIEELHLSFTQGQWMHDQWQYPVLDAPPGAELYAWFSPAVKDVDAQWKKLTSTLAGLFCASLNFIDNFNTVNPQLSIWPQGVFESNQNISHQLRYATLPREIVCTENLTPWKKLLPCESNRGFSTLLNSRMIHNTNYHSLGVHYRKMCVTRDCQKTHLEIKQTVSLIYDNQIMQSTDWSFRRLFGQGLSSACALSTGSTIYVDITSNITRPFLLIPGPDRVVISERGGTASKYAIYDISPNGQMVNIVAKHDNKNKLSVNIPPPLHFNRYVVGYGKEFGGIVTELVNNHWSPIVVVLMENAPWWLPIKLSSLRINGATESDLLLSQFYSLGRSRQKPYHLELTINLPPRTTTIVTIKFEFVFLKWQEYPPDANHGFYIGSAVVAVNLPTARGYTSIPLSGSSFNSSINASQQWYPAVLRTNGAMVSLPTPDFSMPYNVICLACTVVALAFGPLHNFCTKDFVLKPVGLSFKQKILNFFKRKTD